MLRKSLLIPKNVIQNFIRNSSEGGIAGENLPFKFQNRYAFTFKFIVFYALGMGAPYLVLAYQLYKKG